MIMIEYELRREKTCLWGPQHLYYLCSEDKGADQLRSYRASATLFLHLYHHKGGSHDAAHIMSDFPSSLKGLVVMVLVLCPSSSRRRGGLVVERRTPERGVGGSILTQVAVLYP